MTLSDAKLLERCMLGTTQNPNECVDSMVWVLCPKHKHHCVKLVPCAVASAVCHYHSGASSRLRIMERLSIPGASTRLASNVKDNKRKRKSDLQATAKERKHSQGEQLLRTHREEALREAEEVNYEVGGF